MDEQTNELNRYIAKAKNKKEQDRECVCVCVRPLRHWKRRGHRREGRQRERGRRLWSMCTPSLKRPHENHTGRKTTLVNFHNAFMGALTDIRHCLPPLCFPSSYSYHATDVNALHSPLYLTKAWSPCVFTSMCVCICVSLVVVIIIFNTASWMLCKREGASVVIIDSRDTIGIPCFFLSSSAPVRWKPDKRCVQRYKMNQQNDRSSLLSLFSPKTQVVTAQKKNGVTLILVCIGVRSVRVRVCVCVVVSKTRHINRYTRKTEKKVRKRPTRN